MIVFAAGMSRSGGTVQYQMLKALIEGAGLGRGHGHPKPVDVPDGKWILYKSEPCEDWMAKLIRQDKARALSIYRDPRDVIVSLMRFFEARRIHRPKAHVYDGFGEILAGPFKDAVTWFKRWEKQGIFVVRYEDVRGMADGWTMLARSMAKYLGIPCCLTRARDIARQFSISKNIARQQALDTWLDVSDTLLTKEHIGPKNGQPGQWREILTTRQEREIIALVGQDWMERHGYG